jgi:hypothetical protein
MLCSVALVRTDVSVYFFEVRVGCWLRLTLFLVHRFLSPWGWRRCPSETSILTRVTCHNIPEYGILHGPKVNFHKTKIKVIMHWAMKTYGEWRLSGQLHAPVALSLGGKSPRCSLYRKPGGPQSRSERRGKGRDLSPAGNKMWAVQPVDRPYTELLQLLQLNTWWRKHIRVPKRCVDHTYCLAVSAEARLTTWSKVWIVQTRKVHSSVY